MEPRPGVLTVRETAQLLRISESKVLDGLRRGLIPGQKVLGQWRTLRADLYRWLSGPNQSWPHNAGDVPR